jgi:hypothetical protein
MKKEISSSPQVKRIYFLPLNEKGNFLPLDEKGLFSSPQLKKYIFLS